ncbi:MFS transporter [Rubrobacter tropicus]|uniref:MFS transporter n=1 Tax=Rubrobacter tropicus TaxID=2653851 RepID=UPI001AA006DF|nr:MFS transporter [Rubrobacter tropicus]
MARARFRRTETAEGSRDHSQEEGTASFLALLFSQLLGTTAFMFVVPFMPLYVQALGVEDVGHAAAWAGVINGASGATMALVAPLWGRLSDRMGRKLMLLRATIAAVVVVGSMAFVTGPWQLLVLRLLQGTLTGTVPAATSLVAATAPAEKAGWRLGALQTVIFVAAGVGPALGGISADSAGLRASFFIASALLVVSSVVVLLGVRENKPVVEEAENTGDEGEPERASLPYKLLLPGLLTLFAVHVSITSAAVALPGFVGALAGAADRVASQAGWIIGTGALVASLGSLLGGRLAARFGARRVMVVSLALAGAAALPQALSENVPQLWILRLLASLFIGCAIPVANLAIKSAAPAGRQGEAFGVASSATSAGFALGPVGGGLLAASLGFWSAFLVPGVLLLALAVALVIAYAPRTGKATAAWKALIASITR